MKFIHVLILILVSKTAFSQVETVKFYQIHELKNASVDTIFAIDLKKSNLTEIPEEIYKFTNLQYLDLSKNKLTEVKNLEIFSQLRYLNLEKNKLIYFPIGICQLYKLETLIISKNDISSIPACIEYCQNLKMLDLWSTAITSLPSEMAKLPALEKIDFTGISINKQGQERIKNLLPKVKLILDSPCNCAL